MYIPTPFLPEDRARTEMLERALEVIERSRRLSSSIPVGVQPSLRHLLRLMNSYYSNRIEGQHTTPREIEEALHHQASSNDETARKQRLALAHIEVETTVTQRWGQAPYHPMTITEIHAHSMPGPARPIWTFLKDAA